MRDISRETSETIYAHVRKDLEPGLLQTAGRISLALISGGLLSMFFCGQFGIGFSTMARGWNHAIHAHMGAIPCAIVCGIAFSVVPAFVLRFISSGVLFRKIIHQHVTAQAGLTSFAGLGMYLGGSFMNEFINVSVWSLSAFISFRLLGLIIDHGLGLATGPSRV